MCIIYKVEPLTRFKRLRDFHKGLSHNPEQTPRAGLDIIPTYTILYRYTHEDYE